MNRHKPDAHLITMKLPFKFSPTSTANYNLLQITFYHSPLEEILQNLEFITVSLVFYPEEKMQLIIATTSDEFAMEVSPQEPILQIKQKIGNILGIPVSSFMLSVLGLELIDGLDMEDYPIIDEGTRIDLTFNSMHTRIPIMVKFSSKCVSLEVDTTETVRSLKEKIHIIDGTPIKRMSLYTSGVEMEDEFRYLGEYGVCEYSEIVVFLKSMSRIKTEPPSRRLSLVVQTSTSLLNGASIPLEMEDANTVREVKEMLLGRKILPTDEYIFIHKQRIMRDNWSLRWHGVENGDYLYVFKGSVSNGRF